MGYEQTLPEVTYPGSIFYTYIFLGFAASSPTFATYPYFEFIYFTVVASSSAP
jgi:hypothetical protein